MTDTVPQEITGSLECGLSYEIKASRKKSPGIRNGMHYIAVFQGIELPIPELPHGAFRQLSNVAHEFAEQHAFEPGAYRVAYNGPGVGRRNHAHIHIMLPRGDDKLPTLVETGDTVQS